MAAQPQLTEINVDINSSDVDVDINIGGHFGCAADWKGFGGGGGSFFAADQGVGAMKGPVVFAEVQLMLNAMVSGPATGGLARRG